MYECIYVWMNVACLMKCVIYHSYLVNLYKLCSYYYIFMIIINHNRPVWMIYKYTILYMLVATHVQCTLALLHVSIMVATGEEHDHYLIIGICAPILIVCIVLLATVLLCCCIKSELHMNTCVDIYL